ncbi:WAT1-related protein At1g43650-like [Prosopis cineraria]|uniref:WAT1-related protein At1g43650-like n=1 Tax=Prosopis cineraria TaxID=364024 RepID=UPI0024107BBB|nr:WAT1-related protein At1g43650-like [Prosopis cineraria]
MVRRIQLLIRTNPTTRRLPPLLTVAKTFAFDPSLLQPKPFDTSFLLAELGLSHLAHTRLADRYSGGERRRVSFGLSLFHDPTVLLLYEPTSGHVSAGAFNVMQILKIKLCFSSSNHCGFTLLLPCSGYWRGREGGGRKRMRISWRASKGSEEIKIKEMKMVRSSLRFLARNRAYVAMISNQVIYSGMALLSKAAIAKGLNPFVFVIYRQALASLVLAPFAFFDRKQDSPLSFNLLCQIFLVSLVGITLSANFYCAALNYISATFATAFSNIVPCVTFILAVALRVESVSLKHMDGKAKILGTILSLSGAIIYAFVKGPPIGSMNGHPSNEQNNSESLTASHSKEAQIKGFIFTFSSNFTLALWLILQGFVVKKYTVKLRLTALQCLFCCMQTAVLGVILERDPSAWKLGWDINLLTVVYCGVVVTGISYWLQLCTIEEKGAVFSALFTPLSLIITAIFSTLVWRETLLWGSIGGMILLVIGLYAVLWGKHRENKRTKAIMKLKPLNNQEDTITLHWRFPHRTRRCPLKHPQQSNGFHLLNKSVGKNIITNSLMIEFQISLLISNENSDKIEISSLINIKISDDNLLTLNKNKLF